MNGAVLWANLHLLFWLSMFPFATAWMGEHPTAAAPAAVYGLVLLMAALAWFIMQTVIVRAQGANSRLASALGGDFKGKASPLLYVAGMALAFISPWISQGVYLGVALMWLVPDRRMERAVEAGDGAPDNRVSSAP